MDEKMLTIVKALQEGIGSLARVQEKQTNALSGLTDRVAEVVTLCEGVMMTLDSMKDTLVKLDKRLSEVERRVPTSVPHP